MSRKFLIRFTGLFSLLMIAGVVLLTSASAGRPSGDALCRRFSFLQTLPRCRITGADAVDAAVRAFRARYRIANPNMYPAHSGIPGRLNWQLGVFTSRVRNQVETHAALFTPPGVTVSGTPFLITEGMRFDGFTVAVPDGRPSRKARFRVDIVDARSGDALGTVTLTNTGRWTPFSVPLRAYKGKRVLLRLSAAAPDGVFPFWGEPVLYGPGVAPGPNVLVILVDAMRGDVIGSNGSRLGITPNIDRYAARGASFLRAFANANWTRPSELSMFTGLFPRRLRINQLDFPVSADELDFFYKKAGFLTMPEHFRRAGYRTRGIINNIFLQAFTGTGVDIGFDQMSDFRTLNRDTPDITRESLSWIRRHRSHPWFVFCNYNTPHKPYSAPPEFRRQIRDDPAWRFEGRVRDYLAEVAFADHWIGHLLDGLDRDGILKNTIVVITADHGEVLWPWHNYSTVYSAFTRFGHSLTMLDEELHVPLILFGPGIGRGKRIRDLVQLVDLFATLAALTGNRLPDGMKQDGRDLSPLLTGTGSLPERPVYTQGLMLEALRTVRYKYVRRPPGFDRIGPMAKEPVWRVPEELYDLEKDPQERRNIAASHPVALSNMRRLFDGYADRRTAGHLVLRWPPGSKRASVRLTTEGTFYPVPAGKRKAEPGRISPDGRELVWRIDRKGGRPRDGLVFSVHPDYAPVRFSITLDGKPVPAGRFYVGKPGMAALKGDMRLSTRGEFAAVVSRGEPLPLMEGEPGFYFYREPGTAVRYSSDTTRLSTEIKTVLRDWGYIQK